MNAIEYKVKHISRMECAPYILERHYAKRWPSISFYFGLFHFNNLVGVCTYGTPASATLKIGIAGKDYKSDVIELNRLCLLNNIKNEASYLISKSLQMLPQNKIIVSYADTSMGHSGKVYQAANFIYCGLSAKRTDWKVKGKEHLHGQTVADEFRGFENRAEKMREKYGDDFYLQQRPRKHRYISIIGSKSYRKKAIKNLKYDIEAYP